MGLLVGLPLKIFYMLFTVLRIAWPVLLGLLIWLVLKRLRKHAGYGPVRQEPDMDGPVVEVDYQVVEDDKEE